MARHIIRNEDFAPPKKTKEEIEKENDAKLREIYINSEHPNTMENSSATFLWIIVMVVGAIFTGGWVIWIVATIIWRRFIKRKEIRAKRWDETHKK